MSENPTLTQRFEQAISSFDSGDTYTALNEFVALHQEGFHREEILTFLNDVSYEPNLPEMKANFEKTVLRWVIILLYRASFSRRLKHLRFKFTQSANMSFFFSIPIPKHLPSVLCLRQTLLLTVA